MSLCLEIVGASIMAHAFDTPQGRQQWAALIKQSGSEIFPYTRSLSGSTYRSAGGGADQIVQLNAHHSGATINILGFIHAWGNQASNNGNYPTDWDATEIANYTQDISDAVAAMNSANLTDAIFSNLSYRTNATGSGGINADIIEPTLTSLGETAFDLYGSTYAGAQNGDYYYDQLHPDLETGLKYIHVPLLAHIEANFSGLFTKRDYEDRIIISFGSLDTPRMPYVEKFTAAGTKTLTTQGGDAGGSLTLGTLSGSLASTGSGYAIGHASLVNNYFWNSEHTSLASGTVYGNNATYTVNYSNAAWAGRDVRIRVTGFRDATGRETDVTLAGETIRIDPQNVTASRTAEFLVTLDGSGNAPQITGAPVGSLSYITGMSIDLMPQPAGGSQSIGLSIGIGIGL